MRRRSVHKCVRLGLGAGLVVVTVTLFLGIARHDLGDAVKHTAAVRVAARKVQQQELSTVVAPPAAEASPNNAEAHKQEGNKPEAPDSSLSGERVHRLPNDSAATTTTVGGFDVDSVLEQMDRINALQFIRNEDIFGPVDNNTVVIAIQVHNRLEYLRQLIVSLSQAEGIETTLLVFSHDFWDADVNRLVESVDFAKCMQIFYPYSIQTHPNAFPGDSPGDCPRDAKADKDQVLNCTNAKWPDLYGHFREAKFSQTKHHWWWKANRIFDQLHATKTYNGLVLFVEEDHEVAEDFLHVLRMVEEERVKNHKNCDIICLGTYLKTHNYPRTYNAIEVTPWLSAKHNMGMAFTRELWRRIQECTQEFCNFDDYNWDWSLFHVSQQCFKEKIQVMLVKAPRIFHIGECGVHHNKKDCKSSSVAKKVQDILRGASKYLFPKSLVVAAGEKKKLKIPRGNGGWGDLRDRQLCAAMASDESPESIAASLTASLAAGH